MTIVSRCALAALALTICAAMAFASDAVAAKTTVRTIGASTTGATGGLFSTPRGVAVNKTGSGGVPAGTFYVVDSVNRRVQRFSPTGAFVGAWGWGVATGSGQYEICQVAAGCNAGLNGTGAGEFGSSGPQGIAVDQATGTVYVSDQASSNRRIDAFGANGSFQGAFGWGARNNGDEFQFCTSATGCANANTTAGGQGGKFGAAIGGLAVDGGGNVYVADKTNLRVDVFKPTFTFGAVTGAEFLRAFGKDVVTGGVTTFEVCTVAASCKAGVSTTEAGGFGSSSPADLAIDSAGNLYVLDSGNKRVQKFDSTPAPVDPTFGAAPLVATFGAGGNLYSIAIDSTIDHVYVVGSVPTSSPANQIRVAEIDAAGAGVETHGADLTRTSANGLAAAPGSLGGNLYISSNQATQSVFVLNEAPLMKPVTTFAGTSATFEGEVVSNNFAVEYHFEYSTDGGATWTSVPVPDAAATAAPGKVVVSQAATGLVGSQAYRVRLVQNRPLGGGSATSVPVEFTTATAQPAIAFTGVSAVTSSSAVLEADVNPENQATTYHFEYGLADCEGTPCTSAPAPDGNVGNGNQPSRIVHEVQGLQPDTVYHFRVVAVNPSGTSKGPDRTFRTFATESGPTDCPNQDFRTGPSAGLPDCRAYEMVSPLDKSGASILSAIRFNTEAEYTSFKQASVGGTRVTYSAARAFGDCVSTPWSSQYISSREAAGWSTHCINPPRGRTVLTLALAWDLESAFEAFTPDLSSAWLRDDNFTPLTGDALPAGCLDLYRRDNLNDSFEALSRSESGVTPSSVLCPPPSSQQAGLRLGGYSADFSHMVFVANGPLTSDAVANTRYQVYDLHDGELELVSILPNETANTLSSFVGTLNSASSNRSSNLDHAVSTDGSHIFWTSRNSTSADGGPGQIYVRVDGATTIPVSESISTAAARFWTAAADGSRAIFSFTEGAVNEDLYEFDVATETKTLIAHKSAGIAGAADDLSRVYFVSTEALDAGAVAGAQNLYLWHEGTRSFIATLSSAPVSAQDVNTNLSATPPSVVSPSPLYRTSRVTADGRVMAFTSFASLTGYDNTDAVTGEKDLEVYRYDAGSDELTCVSCNPTGQRPVGTKITYPYSSWDFTAGNNLGRQAALLPTCERQLYCSRVLTDDGDRLYFHSSEALVSGDTNGAQDVYQWEAQGTADCHRFGGCLDLISTGKSPERSEFYDASADGSDVFFSTLSGIDPRDDGLIDVYDARVGGGFPPAPTTPECVGDACHSSPPPPGDPTLSSAAASGPGDPKPHAKGKRCARGQRVVRRHGKRRCVKRRHGGRRANHERRAGR